MSQDVTGGEGFLCDNATMSDMVVKHPVYVCTRTHTYTHHTCIPVVLTADSKEKLQ